MKLGPARLLAAATLICLRAHAEPQSRAATLFEQGMREYDSRDYADAAKHLREAYDLSPHPVVLYNLILAYKAANESSLALAAIQTYLSRSDTQNDPRRAALADLKTELTDRTEMIRVVTVPEHAIVELNGSPLPPGPGGTRIDRGSYALTVRANGFEPLTLPLKVEGRDRRRELTLVLKPASLDPGVLTIRCGVPNTDVAIGDRPWSSVVRPIVLPAGPHQLRFKSTGYVFRPQSVELKPGAHEEVDCQPSRADRPGTARLELDPGAPIGARVLVDEKPYFGEGLGAGEHQVEIRSPGKPAWSASITLREAEVRRVEPPQGAEPTSRGRPAPSVLAPIFAGTGVAMGITAGVIALVNQGRYDNWQSREQELAADPDAPASEHEKNDELSRSIKFWDGAALGLALGAIPLTAAGGILFFTTRPSPANTPPSAMLNFRTNW